MGFDGEDVPGRGLNAGRLRGSIWLADIDNYNLTMSNGGQGEIMLCQLIYLQHFTTFLFLGKVWFCPDLLDKVNGM